MPKWVRVLTIVLISVILIAATLFIVILSLYGAFSHLTSSDGGPLAILFVYGVFLLASLFSIFVLVRGFWTRDQNAAYASYGAPAIVPVADTAKVEQLRYALIASVALAGVSIAFNLMKNHNLGQSAYVVRLIINLLVSFVLFEGPYIALLIMMLTKLHKSIVAFSLILPWAFILHSLFVLISYMSFFRFPYLVFVVAGAAVEIAIFIFALQLKDQIPQTERGSSLAMASVLSVVYVVVASIVTTYLPRWLYRL